MPPTPSSHYSSGQAYGLTIEYAWFFNAFDLHCFVCWWVLLNWVLSNLCVFWFSLVVVGVLWELKCPFWVLIIFCQSQIGFCWVSMVIGWLEKGSIYGRDSREKKKVFNRRNYFKKASPSSKEKNAFAIFLVRLWTIANLYSLFGDWETKEKLNAWDKGFFLCVLITLLLFESVS